MDTKLQSAHLRTKEEDVRLTIEAELAGARRDHTICTLALIPCGIYAAFGILAAIALREDPLYESPIIAIVCAGIAWIALLRADRAFRRRCAQLEIELRNSARN